MKKNPCQECRLQDYCADNDWCLGDETNPLCPNYEAIIKELKIFAEERKQRNW